jgi:hypothetical protein
MSYFTVEKIRCDGCGIRLPQDVELDFGLPTEDHWEKLSRMAVDDGWLFISAPPPRINAPVQHTQHFCPKCRSKQKTRS